MAEQKYRPVYNDPAQRQEMQRLELGEAMARGDQDRVDEITAAMKARGDRDIGYEKSKSSTAYSQFVDREEERANEFKPVTAEEMRQQQRDCEEFRVRRGC